MAKNVTSFDVGNTANLRLTPEIHELFVNTIRASGRVSIAAGRCCVGQSTVRDWLRKGRRENAEPIFVEFADAVEKARAEYLALAAKRLGQLAQGGTLMLPKYDRENRLIRDENDELVFEERFFPPEVRALTHILDRIDPAPNLEPAPDYFPGPELSDEQKLAEGAMYFDLFRAAYQVFIDLGVPPPAIIEQHAAALEAAIETTSSPVPAEPEPAKESDSRRTT